MPHHVTRCRHSKMMLEELHLDECTRCGHRAISYNFFTRPEFSKVTKSEKISDFVRSLAL